LVFQLRRFLARNRLIGGFGPYSTPLGTISHFISKNRSTSGVVGITAITGGPTMSRYTVRNAVGSLPGQPFDGVLANVFECHC